MRWIKRIVTGLVLVVVLAVAAAYLLPSTATVSRSIEIAATPEQVFPYISNFHSFNRWSPWAKRDPETRYTFEGPEQGTGQKMMWVSDNPNVGSGSQEITSTSPDKSVEVALDFGDMGQANAAYRLEPVNSGTRITWSFKTELGANPMKRYLGLMFDRWIGAEYEEGLVALKQLVESEI